MSALSPLFEHKRTQRGHRFYVDLLGMKVTEDDGKQCRLVFGNNMLIPRNRAGGGPARVDHIAYTVTNWDAEKDGLEEELKRRGLQYRGSAKTSFHIKDPEGMGVQFGGLINDRPAARDGRITALLRGRSGVLSFFQVAE